MESLINLDKEIFLYIQLHWHNAAMDWLCPILRNGKTWYPLYAILFLLLAYLFKKEVLKLVLMAAVTITLSDSISAKVIKPLVQRDRPCNDSVISAQFTPLIKCGSGYSFPSSHASNHFALATLLGLVFLKRGTLIICIGSAWAAAISFSQVYVGVHYPLDVLSGAVLGIMIGWGVCVAGRKFLKLQV